MEHIAAALAAATSQSDQVADLLSRLHSAGITLDVFICSYGGVGSSELSNFLSAAGLTVNLLEDKDNLRHRPTPPVFSRPQQTPRHIVYLYGCPVAAVASHYRRGHAHHQALKTSSQRLAAAIFPATFEDYLQRGEDLFGLQHHFTSWLATPTQYPVIFLRYESMFEPAVGRALLQRLVGHNTAPAGIEAAASRWCASHKERRSKVTAEQLASSLYSRLKERMASLPPLFLRLPDGAIEPLLPAEPVVH